MGGREGWQQWKSGLPGSASSHDCLVIAEVAQAHDGSLGTAHAFIDAIAEAGADAVKFQTHIASAESTPGEPWRVRFSPQDETRYEYWKRMEFREEQWAGLRKHAVEAGLLFLSSPFSLEAVDLLTRVGVSAWKIASGEISNVQLLAKVAKTGLPIILSSGMSDMDELDAAVNDIRAKGVPLAVLQCTTAYPCPPEKIGLNVMTELGERYDGAMGLSDHSGTIYPSIAATTLGAEVIEVHITLSKQAFGPDVGASVTPDELKQLVEGVRFVERMRRSPLDKNEIALEMQPLRNLFTRSVVARSDLASGTVVNENHLIAKKPGTGIPAKRMPELLGMILTRDVRADELLAETDFTRGS